MQFEFALSIGARMKGLLDPVVCEQGEVLVLLPCGSIHTFGMTEAIDVAFVGKQGYVLDAVKELPPRRLLSCQKAVCVLERRSALSDDAWFEPGDILELTLRAVGCE
jgi:uncharacterized membrane protein (UPF0127 family)